MRLIEMSGSGTAGIPKDSSVLIPRLVCREPAAAIDFYLAVFEAVEVSRRPGADGEVAHALLTISGEMFMVEAEWPTLPSRAPLVDGTSPVVMFVYVEDVDRVVERAVQNGAQILVPLTDQFWGDRTAWIMDPAGHVWTVASRIEQTTAGERTRRWSALLTESNDEPE